MVFDSETTKDIVISMKKTINLTVSNDFIGERLDRFIPDKIADLSRSYVQRLIDKGLIIVNEKIVKSGYKVKKSDQVIISLPEPEETSIKPEKIKLNIVYEDKHLVVIDKPQGMVTHPASGIYTGTLVNALLHHCKDSLSGINGVLRPGIVHRLDKETSGLIIVCKNDKAHTGIAGEMKDRKIKKYYYAIVHGNVQYDHGVINKPIGRDKIHRHKMAVVQNGRNAITHWKVLKRFGQFTLLECNLETGRTHQIRVHMKSLGHSIAGDKTYGKKNDPTDKMMLHAHKLVFTHPISNKEIKLETEMPERFSRFMDLQK